MSDRLFVSVHTVLRDQDQPGGRGPLVDYLKASIEGASAQPPPLNEFAEQLIDEVTETLHGCATFPLFTAAVSWVTSDEDAFLFQGYVHDDSHPALFFGLAALLAPYCYDQHMMTSVATYGGALPVHVVAEAGVPWIWDGRGAPTSMTAEPLSTGGFIAWPAIG